MHKRDYRPGQRPWRTFTILAAAHTVNDMSTNFLQQIIPFLIITKGFSVASGASLVSIHIITNSLTQPAFGYMVDIKGQRWMMFVGTLWMTLLLGSAGFINNYYAAREVPVLTESLPTGEKGQI